uniref:C2H2-type domain-containing protein n=1 Tax=Eptatretus burgeri TaxID=7764 RepID=A0A8C4Q1N0_EPTBU
MKKNCHLAVMNNQQTYVSVKTSEDSAEEATQNQEGESDSFVGCDVTESALHTKKEEMQNVILRQPKDEETFCHLKSPVSQAMDESFLGKLLGHSYVKRLQDEETDGVKIQAQMTSGSQDIFPVSPNPSRSEICSGESQGLGCDSEPNLTPRSGMIQSFVKCSVCSFVATGGYSALSQHLAATHAEAFPLKCEFCLRIFRTIPELVTHRTSAHSLPDHLLPCPKCPATFAFKENLKAHINHIHQNFNLGQVGNATLTDISNKGSNEVKSWIKSLKQATTDEECSADSQNLISHKDKTDGDGLHNNSTSMKDISSDLMLDMPTSKSPEKLDNFSTYTAGCDSMMQPLEMPFLEKEVDSSQNSGDFKKVNTDPHWKFLESQQEYGLSTLTMTKNFEVEFQKIESNSIGTVEPCKPSLSCNDSSSLKEIGEANQTSNDTVLASQSILPSASRLVLRPQNFTDPSQTHLYCSLVEGLDEDEKKTTVTRLRALLSGTYPIPSGVHILGDVNAARYPTYRPEIGRRRSRASGEWQMELVEQQAHAKIDPRTNKEEEDDDGWLCDPSFIGPAVQGRAPPRSDASSPESCVPIGPCAARLPWPEAASLVHPARHRQAVELFCSKHGDMNRTTPNSRAVFLARPRATPVKAPAW